MLSEKTLAVLNSGNDAVAANEYAGLGAKAIIPTFLMTFIANGIAEEILFRDFFCKRLSRKLGSAKGVLLAGIPVRADAFLTRCSQRASGRS